MPFLVTQIAIESFSSFAYSQHLPIWTVDLLQGPLPGPFNVALEQYGRLLMALCDFLHLSLAYISAIVSISRAQHD